MGAGVGTGPGICGCDGKIVCCLGAATADEGA